MLISKLDSFALNKIVFNYSLAISNFCRLTNFSIYYDIDPYID